MNQIEKNNRYEIEADNVNKRQYNSVLYLTNRQVSFLTASIMLLAFFVFMAGYFLGQRKALERFNEVIDREVSENVIATHTDVVETHIVHNDSRLSQNEATSKIVVPEELYKAQLIGFGTSRAAHSFADKLQNKNMPVRVDERHSKTAQGKEIIWYQVTTEPFSDKQELLAFVEKVKKAERLKDIRIVSC